MGVEWNYTKAILCLHADIKTINYNNELLNVIFFVVDKLQNEMSINVS